MGAFVHACRIGRPEIHVAARIRRADGDAAGPARHTYEARIEALIARGAKAGLDAFAIYGDREHAANVAYLSGYDPRFEETLLVIVARQRPRLLVGNEGWGYAEICRRSLRARALPDLLACRRSRATARTSLTDILAGCGLKPGQRIGAIGWKPFGAGDAGFDETTLDLPSFIADTLRTLVGDKRRGRQCRRPDDEPRPTACAPSTRPTSSPPSSSPRPSPRKGCATCCEVSSPA